MNKKEMKLIKGTRFLSRSFQFNNKYYTKMIIDIGNIEIPIPLAYYKYFEVTPRKIRQIVNNNEAIICFDGLLRRLTAYKAKDNEKVLCVYKYKIKRTHRDCIELLLQDYYKLGIGVFLNDKIVNFYMKLLEDTYSSKENNIFITNSYFYSLLSKGESGDLDQPLINYRTVMNKKMNIFECKMIIIPICDNNHWSLIIINRVDLMSNIFDKALTNNVDMSQKEILFPEIFYLDSYYDYNEGIEKSIRMIKKYLFYEYQTAYPDKVTQNAVLTFNDIISIKSKFIRRYVPKVPKQTNSYDCGIYMLVYTELFLFNSEFFLTNARKINAEDNAISKWFERSILMNKRNEIMNLLDSLNKGDSEIPAYIDRLTKRYQAHFNTFK